MKKREREQVKQRLYSNGLTIKAWAQQHGYPVNEVYKVLNGERKGLYGKSYQIAKELGLRD